MNLNYKKDLICELFNIFKEGTFLVLFYILFLNQKLNFLKYLIYSIEKIVKV